MELRILRLENSQGQGVYACAYGTACAHAANSPDPSPREDGIPAIRAREYCGFIDETQMRNWFSNRKMDMRLYEQGIEVSTYLVDEQYVRKGGHQIVFERDEATMVDRQPLHCYA